MKRMRMFKILAGVILLSTQAIGAYLPVVGPAPLRFRATPPRVALLPGKSPNRTHLPPLGPDLATANATSLAGTNALALAALGTPAISLEPLTQAVASPDPELALLNPATNVHQTAASQIPGTDPLTPQMMMHFFQSEGTNGIPERGVSVPLMFIPPVPVGPRPSSRAVVIVPPAP